MRRIHPRNGDQRVVRRFLWYPVRIGLEERWLERVRLVQSYHDNSWHTSSFEDNDLLDKIEGGKKWVRVGYLHEVKELLSNDHRVDWTSTSGLAVDAPGGWVRLSKGGYVPSNGYFRTLA